MSLRVLRSAIMQFRLTLFLLFIVTDADKHDNQIVKYNKYYAPNTTPSFLQLNTSSLLKCAATCATYEMGTCKGYSFVEGSCWLYGNGLVLSPNDDQLGGSSTALWSSYSGYKGCWLDARGQRDLADLEFTMEAAVATIEHCIDSCKMAGYVFAGVQYHDECRCGNSFGRHGKKPELECNTPCLGDPTTMCGGGLRNSIYSV